MTGAPLETGNHNTFSSKQAMIQDVSEWEQGHWGYKYWTEDEVDTGLVNLLLQKEKGRDKMSMSCWRTCSDAIWMPNEEKIGRDGEIGLFRVMSNARCSRDWKTMGTIVQLELCNV